MGSLNGACRAPDLGGALVGGAGADRLTGNGGDDSQVGGLTAYDADYQAPGLLSLLAEWGRADRTFAQRVDVLRPLLNGDPTAGALTVFDDDAADVLNGLSGQDWVLAQLDGDNRTATDQAYLAAGGRADDVDAVIE